MSRIKKSLDPKRIRRLIWLVLTLFFLFGYSLQSVAGSTYYSMLVESYGIVRSPPVIVQNGTTGSSLIYTNSTSAKVSVQAPAGWLSGWDNRVKITVDKNGVDSTLSNFPALIYLSNSSGRNNDDVSFVFDELQSSTNRKKIAVTTSDGITQCYVEIEKWDDANEQGWLWVKVPSISNMFDTNLHLYYDADHIDNTDYVGDPGSTSALNVWDSNFEMVQHFEETSGSHNDSTANSNDGIPSSNLEQGISAMIDGGDYFDGTPSQADHVNWSSSDFNLDFDSSFTIELLMQSYIGTRSIFAKGDGSIGYLLGLWNDGDVEFFMQANSSGRAIRRRVNASALGGAWHPIVVVYNGSRDVSGLTIYVDSDIPGTQTTVSNIQAGDSMQTDLVYRIGRTSNGTAYWYQGYIDEFRISNISRSAAWIKASYESERDDLLDFGSKEIWNWWNTTYDYRKRITIANNIPSTLGSGYSVLYTTDAASLVSSGKMLSNGNDLRIVYWNGSAWIELDRDIIDMNTSSTQVWFKTQADISASGSDDNYYMYYSNPSAVNPPASKSNVYDFWDDFDDSSLDSAWNFSQIGTASGSCSESGTVVILNATDSGDLWGTSDNILFLSISRSYDVLIESYTSSWGGSHGTWSKMGGVQLRENLNGNSKNRIMSPVYSATGATNSYRLSTGGSTSEQITATQPGYNRLSRIGGTSRAWYSTNGTSWTELGSQISFSSGLSDPIRLGIHLAGSSSSSHWVEVDWFKVRKYVDPEPTLTSNGEERITYDYVLRINNNVTDPWQIRLKEYSDSNINRLENCTIYFHNSTHGTSSQIIIQNGSYTNQTGPWYDIGDSETIYIAMTVEASSTGTSYVYTYLEIRFPGTTTYLQYIITFEIT